MIKFRHRKQTGMSLIEVVIAIAISGFILLASAASFVVSITDIWSKREQRYAFYEHADGVSQFLNLIFVLHKLFRMKTLFFRILQETLKPLLPTHPFKPRLERLASKQVPQTTKIQELEQVRTMNHRVTPIYFGKTLNSTKQAITRYSPFKSETILRS